MAITAPAGHSLVVADSSNIELRTNHTLAGQDETVASLKAGRDLYKEFASVLYNKPEDEITKDERFDGKVAHLGLGYGMGWKKFQDTCRRFGKPIDDETAQRIVTTYRDTYDAIPRLWRDADRLLKAMADGIYYELQTAPFVRARKGVLLTPPQHHIQYPRLTRTEDGFEYQSRRGRGTETVRIYGPKIVENLCQHISRNILMEQLVTISRRYPVALMVHDEFVLVVPDEEAEEALAWTIDVMSTAPEWWPEIPLAAEGSIAKSYGAAK